MAGVIFDDMGEAWPAHPAYLARRLGCPGGNFDVITHAVRKFGFVHVAPIRDALLVRFEPSTVRHFAAFGAFYEIARQAPKRLVLAYPGKAGGSDRYEIFNSLIAGLERVEAALNRARSTVGLDTAQAEDNSKRLSRPLDSIVSEDEWLGQVLSMWRSARTGWRLPSSESFDPLEVMNIARGRAHLVDTSASDPEGYRFRLWGTANPYRGMYKNRTLAQMPAGLMREDAIEDYWEVAATGVPTYQLIHRVENDQPLSYARLLLPLAADARRVDQLVVLINERRLLELEMPGSPRRDA
jgi:hypothetical protein